MKRHHRGLLARKAAAILVAVALTACGGSPDKEFAAAKADYAGGQVNSAIIRLRNLLQADPQFAEARLLLGQVLLETGDPAAAEKELRKAFEAGTETETVKPLLARALLESGEYPRLLSDFPPQQIRSPEVKADVLVSQAYAYLFQGNAKAARELVGQAVSASPDHPRAAIAAALVAGIEGDYAAASSAIDKALSREPKSVEALRAQAIVAQAQGDLPVAIGALQTLTKLRPSEVAAHYTTIRLLWQSGRMEDARAQVERMKAAVPHHPRTEHVLAVVAMRDKELNAARDHVARALKSDPEFGPSLLLSGVVNAQLGAYELAETHLNAVLAKDPTNLPAQQTLIGILLKTQRTKKALALAQEMVAQTPDKPESLTVAAGAYLQAGDAKTAQLLFERATAKGVRDTSALTGLAMARMMGGDADQGVRLLMEASAAEESGIEADLILVNYYVGRKRFDQALARLATIASKRPGDARILLLEGEVLLAAGRQSEARTAFERADELQPNSAPVIRHLARLDLADGQADRARKRFEHSIARLPKDPGILLVYAQWLEEAKSDLDTVRATIEKAVALAPDNADVRLYLVAFHMRRQDLERAVALAGEAATAIPRNERLLTVLADLEGRTGRPDLAAVTLSKAIQIAPTSAELLVRLADVQQTSGDLDAAKASLRKALGVQPGYRPATLRLVALELQANNSPAKALVAARELQRSQPSDAGGYYLEGQVFVQQGNWPEAIRAFRKGIEQSQSPQLVIGLHQSLGKSGRSEEAARVAADWIRANPRDVVVRSYLAESALAAKDYATAARIYKGVVADFPNNVRALNNLAWAASQVGDPKTLEYAERARQLAPDNPQVLDTLGSILVEQGDLARGTELLRQASAAAPNAPNLRLHLAKALIKSGDRTGARRELEALVKLGDQYSGQNEVKKILSSL